MRYQIDLMPLHFENPKTVRTNGKNVMQENFSK
jgi:hypothetical protein